jgi:hypothetical protein
MPGSEGCPPGHIGEAFGNKHDYFFIKQMIHECLFYGTNEMNAAIIELSILYRQIQEDCIKNPDELCDVRMGDSPEDELVTISIDKVVPLGITGTSLPWGGLFDVNGDWSPPYYHSHNGKQANLAWLDREGNIIDDDHKILLWVLIKGDDRWSLPVATEGGDFPATYQKFSSDPHHNPIHIQFMQ